MSIVSPFTDDLICVHQCAILRHGECAICGCRLPERVKAYQGKLKDGTCVIACKDCKDKIDVLLGEYVFFRQEAEIPNADSVLWRYQDFTKFVSLLDSRKLYFTRADSFKDPFEGARGFNYQKDAIYADNKKYLRYSIITRLHDAGNTNPTEVEIEDELNKEMDNLIKKQEAKRKDYYVSCWHENERESEGMWKLYTSAMSQGVAVQTTAERLCRSLKDNRFVLGKVKYVSFDKPLEDSQEPVWYKRDSFAHEREVRVVIKDTACSEMGLLIDVDLETLIEKIYISPTAPPWLAGLVENLVHLYGFDMPIEYSQLNEKPVY